MALPEIKIQNTLTGKKEPFTPITPGKVSFYACGPTVYGLAHVGNAKTAISLDLIRRVLSYAGYDVDFMRNVTDIDDKIIKAANDAGVEWTTIATKFTQTYDAEMNAVGVQRPTHIPTAIGHVAAIMQMVEALVAKDMAYPAETPYGTDVYFRVEKFDGYGKLSKRKLDDMIAGARVEPGEMKQNPMDFALWKAAKPGEPSWGVSSWSGWKYGEGRPGWHIECSAMIHARYPEGIDIHGGGLDLIFPHHENEIAQSEACTGHQLAKYWVHSGLLVFGKEKMSKSLGNIVTTDSFLKSYDGEVLRMMTGLQHYRSPIDFSEESILRAEGLLERLYKAKQNALASTAKSEADAALVEKIRTALFDDFNTAMALGFMLKDLRECFKGDREATGPTRWAAWGQSSLPILNRVFGLLERDPAQALAGIRAQRLKRMGVTEDFSHKVDKMLVDRDTARAQKNYPESDRLRAEIEALGVQVMDGPDGATWALSVTMKPA